MMNPNNRIMQGLQPELLSSLISEIYDCALNSTYWNSTMTRIAGFTNAAYATIALAEHGASNPVIVAHSQLDCDKLNSLNEAFGLDTPGVQQAILGKLDVPVSALGLMSEADLQGSRFYREWLAPQGLRDGCVVKFSHTANRLGFATFATRISRNLISSEERRFIQILSPHMRRAAIMGNLLDQSVDSISAYSSVLDCIASPVFMTDGDGRVCHMNTAAQQVLSQGRGVVLSNNILVATSPFSKSLFADALARVSTKEGGHSQVTVPMTSPGQAPIVAYILPLSRNKMGRTCATAKVVVFLCLGEPMVHPSETLLMSLFDLTPAEARVMKLAGCGRQIFDISAEIGSSENTVKTHLSRVYSKTATARQAELVALTARLTCR
jgi:DNA-binding CsgD family transcriptional regulator/PAS domain-containing protein